MIVKRNFSPKKVMGYVWRPLLYSTAIDLTRTAQSTRWPRCGLPLPSASTGGGTSPSSS